MRNNSSPQINPTPAAATHTSDSAFIHALKGREDAALEKLWVSLYRDSVKIANKYGKSRDLGHCAAIKTYEKLLNNGINNFKFQASFRHYCWVILSRELLRLLKKEPKGIQVEYNEELIVGKTKSLHTNSTVQALERIQSCLNSLSPRRRLVFEMIDLKGMAVAEVAEELALSRNNVSKLASRARNDIRKCLISKGYHCAADVLEN